VNGDIIRILIFAGFNQGDPKILVYPIDSLGQKCGIDDLVKDKPFLFFFDITKV
jgi:choline transporter-like protein 2/4/5